MTEDLILWASADPRYKTGYGWQTAIWTRKFRDEGYNVEIASLGGLKGAPSEWEGIMVWPVETFLDLIALYEQRKAKLIIGLRDFWTINTEILGAFEARCAFWLPIDCDPLDISDFTQINAARAYPIAMSRFGSRMLKQAGVRPFLYVPHGIDTTYWTPSNDPEGARIRSGIPEDVFVIGINATNIDTLRKGWYEQLEAFAMFHAEHPKSMMLMHTLTQDEGSNLEYMTYVLGLQDAVSMSNQWMLKQGLIGPKIMREWYRTIHLLTNCSWGEGFGIPIIEAMSCGVPAVVTNASSMPELVGPGWKVEGERKWNATHNARWVAPSIGGIFEAYEEAYQLWSTNRERWDKICALSRSHARKYDIDRVYSMFWRPALDALFRGRTVTHEADGYKWRIDIDVPTGDGLGASHEAPIEQVVLSLIPRDGVFLDVGAHVGHYSIRASRLASKVIAIEPNPDTVKRLHENITLNDIGNITIHEIAAWDEGANLSLWSPNNALRDGSTRVSGEEPNLPGNYDRWIVQGRPLDAPLRNEPRIDVIKLDVEGADLHALRGMRELIAKHRPVLFIEDHSIYDYYKREDLEALIDELGYDWTDTSVQGFGNYLICRPR